MHPPPPFPKHGHVFRLCPPARFYKPPLFPSLHARKAEMPKRVPPILFFFRRNRKPFFFVERKWQRRPASSLFPFNQIAILCFSRLHICMREKEKWYLPLRGKPKKSRIEAVLEAGIDPKAKQIHALTYCTVRYSTRVLGNLMHKIDTGDR